MKLVGIEFCGLSLGLYCWVWASAGWGVILKVLGVLMLVTGLAGYCPVYSLFKVRTNKMSNE